MNAQYEEEILNARGCLGEVLNIESSREANRSQCFETDILCLFASINNEERKFSNIVIKDKGRGQNMNSIQKRKRNS